MHGAQLAEMYLIALADFVLLVRLLYLGYYKRSHYPFFTLFIIADLAQTIAGIVLAIPGASSGFWWLWTCSEAVVAVLQILAVREVWTRIRASYPGIGRIALSVVEWSFAIALLVAVGSLFFDVLRANWHYAAWSGVIVLRRGISSILALTVATLTLLMRYAPDPIPANVKRHTRIFAAYLTTATIAKLIVGARMLNSETTSGFDLGFDVLWAVCWIVAFRKGEDEPPPTPGTATEGDVIDALNQMRSIVAGLRRIRPKIG